MSAIGQIHLKVPSGELASLSSGCVLTETIKSDLLAAKEKGTDVLTAFFEDRLLSDSLGFFDPLPKLRLGTFRDAQKKTTVSKEGKAVILRTDRNLFARLLVMGQTRQMDLRQLLIHELRPLPWSLALFDGKNSGFLKLGYFSYFQGGRNLHKLCAMLISSQ